MYIPDGMLTEEQRLSKWKSVDERYKKALDAKNDYEEDQRMKLAARNAGYTQEAYHGTNGGNFNEFMWEHTQRADAGWYGRGHYFATRKGEAEMYGKRVISALLNLGKTFNFHNEMRTIDGQEGRGATFDTVAFYINSMHRKSSLKSLAIGKSACTTAAPARGR